MKKSPSTPQEELLHLLEESDRARRALTRLDTDRSRLQDEISGIEAGVRAMQERLSLAERLRVQDAHLTLQLRRLDQEIPEREPVREAPPPAAGAPNGIERRLSPRPAPIPMPKLEPVYPVGLPRGLFERARRVIRPLIQRA